MNKACTSAIYKRIVIGAAIGAFAMSACVPGVPTPTSVPSPAAKAAAPTAANAGAAAVYPAPGGSGQAPQPTVAGGTPSSTQGSNAYPAPVVVATPRPLLVPSYP